MKKQQLIITSLQNRIKELEGRVLENQETVMKGENRISGIAEKEIIDVAEANLRIDKVDREVSEKIALQREEMKKLARDIPEPMNYDPFNYGEAFRGEVVDFESRRRITELKFLLNGLQESFKKFVNNNPGHSTVDLGYKIIRLDELLEATQFAAKRKTGEVASEEVMVVGPNRRGDPAAQAFCNKREMFQSKSELMKPATDTNAIMQTVFRLELEIAELQKTQKRADTTQVQKHLDVIQTDVTWLKNTILSRHDVENLVGKAENMMFASKDSISIQEDFVHKEVFGRTVGRLREALHKLQKEFHEKITNPQIPSQSAGSKVKAKQGTSNQEISCLSCNRPASHAQSPAKTTNIPLMPKFPGKSHQDRMKSRLIVNKGYQIGVNGYLQEFSVPSAAVASMSQSVKLFTSQELEAPPNKLSKSGVMCSHFVRGCDGKMYVADKKTEHNSCNLLEESPCVLHRHVGTSTQEKK